MGLGAEREQSVERFPQLFLPRESEDCPGQLPLGADRQADVTGAARCVVQDAEDSLHELLDTGTQIYEHGAWRARLKDSAKTESNPFGEDGGL